jgi:hypothetical protein
MKIFLPLVVVLFMIGCAESNIKPKSAAESAAKPQTGCDPRYDYRSEPSLWLLACTDELAHGMRDYTVFTPKANPSEEICKECSRIKPLPADKLPIYEKWLTERISEIQSITVGTTRKQVEDILMMSGGISGPTEAIYLHPKCDVLKVRIKFELALDAEGRFSENDKVVSVSMPYLGFSPAD